MRRMITVNGRQYERVEDMPPDVRAIYEQTMAGFQDANGNGVPDIMEGMLPGMGQGQASVVFDNQVYSSLDQMPPEARQLYEQAMGRLGSALQGGVAMQAGFGAPGDPGQWGANPDQQGQGGAGEWGAQQTDMRWRPSDGTNPYSTNPYESAVGPTHGTGPGKLIVIALVALVLTVVAVAFVVILSGM